MGLQEAPVSLKDRYLADRFLSSAGAGGNCARREVARPHPSTG